jgi:hypothetical protein
MLSRIRIAACAFAILSTMAWAMVVKTRSALAEDDQRWAGNLEMNGYRLDSFGDFTKWQLVTVRYRMDSGEFRFIYANPKAWDALKAGKSTYPDGAVFAKVAYLLSHDPRFTSSMTPNRVNRYQLMVRNQEKHKETRGWGYALFNSSGRTYPGEPKAVAQACAACHGIVRDLGEVFAQPLPQKTGTASSKAPGAYLPKYQTLSIEKLPASLIERLPKGTKLVSSIEGDLRKQLFQGTLDEIRPFLAVEALKSNRPAVLLSSDSTRFSLVFPSKSAKSGCDFGGSKGAPMISVVTTLKASPFSDETAYLNTATTDAKPITQEFCFVRESNPESDKSL